MFAVLNQELAFLQHLLLAKAKDTNVALPVCQVFIRDMTVTVQEERNVAIPVIKNRFFL